MGTRKARQILEEHGADAESVRDAAADAEKGWQAAEATDDAVIELIRTELQGRGRPLGGWQPAAAAWD
jgi:hypothetical protein